MIRALEDELEAGCDDERWMLAVSDFEEAIGTLRSVFERLAEEGQLDAIRPEGRGRPAGPARN